LQQIRTRISAWSTKRVTAADENAAAEALIAAVVAEEAEEAEEDGGAYLATKATVEEELGRELSGAQKEKLTELLRQRLFQKYRVQGRMGQVTDEILYLRRPAITDEIQGFSSVQGAKAASACELRLDFEITDEILADASNPLKTVFASW
jgi:hypothetical protein